MREFMHFGRRLVRIEPRSALVAKNAFVSLSARGVSILASFLTVPLVLHHLGHERYGIWMAAIALSAAFAVADGGITKALIARVSEAKGASDTALIRALIGSSLAAVLGFTALFLVITLTIIATVNWRWAFNLSTSEIGREAAQVVSAICVSFALSMPATAIRESRLGLMEGARVSLWDLAGTTVAFLSVVAAVSLDAGLVAIAALWSGIPVLVRYVSSAAYLIGRGRQYLPRVSDVRSSLIRHVLKGGGVYCIFALAQAVAMNSDQLLIARLIGPAAVAEYAVVQRLFAQAQVIAVLFLAAQWPAYGDARGRGDLQWIKSQLRTTLQAGAAVSGVLCLVLGLACRPILAAWVGPGVSAPSVLIFWMVLYGISATAANTFTFFYLALRLHRQLIVSQISLLLIELPLALLLVPRVGPSGAVAALTLGMLGGVIVPGLVNLKKTLGSLGLSASADLSLAAANTEDNEAGIRP